MVIWVSSLACFLLGLIGYILALHIPSNWAFVLGEIVIILCQVVTEMIREDFERK